MVHHYSIIGVAREAECEVEGVEREIRSIERWGEVECEEQYGES